MTPPKLGDSINGTVIGRSNATYYWVRCLEHNNPNCLGDRWALVKRSRYAPVRDGDTEYRMCKPCQQFANRRWFTTGKKEET